MNNKSATAMRPVYDEFSYDCFLCLNSHWKWWLALEEPPEYEDELALFNAQV